MPSCGVDNTKSYVVPEVIDPQILVVSRPFYKYCVARRRPPSGCACAVFNGVCDASFLEIRYVQKENIKYKTLHFQESLQANRLYHLASIFISFLLDANGFVWFDALRIDCRLFIWNWADESSALCEIDYSVPPTSNQQVKYILSAAPHSESTTS